MLISPMRNQLDVVEKAIEVENTRRRKSDDQKAFINSILTSVATTPTFDNKSQRRQLSLNNILVYFSRASRYRLFKQAIKKKIVLLSNVCNKKLSCIDKRRKKYPLISENLTQEIQQWLCNYDDVIYSPINDDTILVVGETMGKKTKRVGKKYNLIISVIVDLYQLKDVGSHAVMQKTPRVEYIYVCIIVFELFLITWLLLK